MTLTSDDIRRAGEGRCPHTGQWAGIFERGDQAAAQALIGHAENCHSCHAEVERLNANTQQPSPLRNLFSAAGIVAAIAGFMTLRGLARVFEQRCHNIGLGTPFWFRPIEERKK